MDSKNITQNGPVSGRGRRAGRLLSPPAGLLLFVTFFLPAVRGCQGEPTYPYQVATHLRTDMLYAAPYLFGLLAVIFGGGWLLKQERSAPTLAKIYKWITAALALPFFYVLFEGLVHKSGPTKEQKMFAVFCAPCLGLFYLLLRRPRLHTSPGALCGRVLFTGGGLCALWFLYLIWLVEPLYGIYLSLISSLLLVASGLLLERSADS
jgi:hypothetical protein